jgi:hypothetical protein
VSEQRVHQVREWVAEARRVHQWERERYGWYRVNVVFTWRRAKKVVREAAQDAAVAWFARRERVRVQTKAQNVETFAALEKSLRVWGASVGV